MKSSAKNNSESEKLDTSHRGRIIVISPHADDAAYSIGGLIRKSIFRSRIQIVTLFGRSNFLRASGFETNWRAVTALRKREDAAFAARIGAQLTYLQYPEAALRIGTSPENLFTIAESPRVEIPGNLTSRLTKVLDRLRPVCLFAPLAVGYHRDHLIARQIAAKEAVRRKLPIIYYEDLPYAGRLSRHRLISHAKSVDHRLRARYVHIDLSGKLNNLTVYRSQVGPPEMQIVAQHATRMRDGQPFERIWFAASRDQLLKVLEPLPLL
jgi:LmbE family N-acetylglucosaminyl deacetylase